MTLHLYPDVIQRDDEWHDLRRGIVTASTVGQLITVGPPEAQSVACPTCEAATSEPCVSLARKVPAPIKTPHDARASLAAEQPPVYSVARNDALTATLVAERITGWTEDTAMTPDMWRGVEMEPFARAAYREHHAPVVEFGFMRRDEDGWTLGLSPDGLVGDDGLIEIKCPRAKAHVATILTDTIPAGYMAQLQAALLVSGRAWIDYVSFVAGMPLYVHRVAPHAGWFAAITAACIAFEQNAAELVAAYTQAAEGLPPTDRIDFEIKVA